jgi:exodeoxyribonuclease V alpha subunit
MTSGPLLWGWEDPDDARRAGRATGSLRIFNDAAVLSAADVHVARQLADLGGEADDSVALAAALAARGPRLGHVCIDLTTVAATAQSDRDETVDLTALPWPGIEGWLGAVAGSPLVSVETAARPDGAGHRPLRLAGTTLYLDRYWRQERQVAADLLDRSAAAQEVDTGRLAGGLRRLFAGDDDLQRLAAAVAVLRRLSVIAGGPGTGKTTTVARVLALIDEQAAADGTRAPKVALAAPTGKAAARLEESVHAEAARLDIAEDTRARLLALRASTIHRLLGWRPDSSSRFRHDRTNRLAYDTVVVDETSMVSLSQMARLVEAVRPDARLVLVGDPDQLSSVEAGAVLADVVGAAARGLRMTTTGREAAEAVTGGPVAADEAPPGATIGDGIVVLRRVHRFGGGIGEVASAIQRGDADATVAALRADPETVTWVEDGNLSAPRREIVANGTDIVAAATTGDGRAALGALTDLRVLCAHRLGPHGVAAWTERIEAWLAAAIADYAAAGTWYAGRPLLVTRNDYSLGLYNGDIGVIVDDPPGGRPAAVFERQGALVRLAPTRLEAVETVHAMTIHKSQGSQFDTVTVVAPDPDARILTRELLYTAVTRARRRVILIGSEAAVRAAVDRPVARASGLQARLWGGPDDTVAP